MRARLSVRLEKSVGPNLAVPFYLVKTAETACV
jgi:hypothetical protein